MSTQLSRVIAADPETVLRAWTDPEQVRLWSCPDGATIDDLQIDLTVGGHYRIPMTGEEGSWTAVGTYREVHPARRLVYTWDWEEKDHKMSQHERLSGSGETIVTVEFRDLGGSTEVVLTHELFPRSLYLSVTQVLYRSVYALENDVGKGDGKPASGH